MTKTITIIGLGWLGQPLAQRFRNLGYNVKGSVSSLKKAALLQQHGFIAFPLEISENGIKGETKALLSNTYCLFIMIPPGLRRNTGADFVLKMANLLEEIKNSDVEKVVLVSSISVYDDSQGEVSEKDRPQPKTNSGKQLLQVEELFAHSEGLQTTVVRFGGLIGGTRQPVKYLTGRKDLVDGHAPVNLIHRDDCIHILLEIVNQDAFGKVFNAVNPHHPLKSAYYTHKAKELGLVPPTFAQTPSDAIFKQVDSENLPLILGYIFKKPLI